mmetsp:Transcript_64377/g.130976  ORF Transcript_64377/g.130976 Transcript_64377/m.130976 type:complete len:267 (+) Transcript_64377:1881-2681(+)
MSSFSTCDLPSQAARAVAVLYMVMSALRLATPSSTQISLMSRRKSSGKMVCGIRSLAARILADSCFSASCHVSRNLPGSRSKAMRCRTTSTRFRASFGAITSHIRPNRSRSCGRSSPSSGFMVPISTNRAGWDIVMPSRWMVFTPEAAASSKTSTRWAGKRLTSSMYKIPRLAAARRPGEKTGFPPDFRVAEKSIEPNTRSSVAPIGRSTKGVAILRREEASSVLSSSLFLMLSRQLFLFLLLSLDLSSWSSSSSSHPSRGVFLRL